MKPYGKPEPRFDIDVEWGGQGELLICDYLDWIAKGNGRVEVKTKRYIDLKFYIETHCDKGRRGRFEPSGINVTTAQVWAFPIGESGIAVLIPVDEIKIALDHCSTEDKEEHDGSCPTRGKLINFYHLVKEHRARCQSPPTKAPPRPTNSGVIVPVDKIPFARRGTV